MEELVEQCKPMITPDEASRLINVLITNQLYSDIVRLVFYTPMLNLLQGLKSEADTTINELENAFHGKVTEVFQELRKSIATDKDNT